MDVAFFELSEMHQSKVILDSVATLSLGNTLHLHSELNVLADGQPWKQGVILKDHDAIGSRTLHRLSIDQNLTGSLRLQAGNQVQERGLAATRWSDDAEKFSGTNFKIDVIQREESFFALSAVAEANVAQADLGHASGPLAVKVAD